MAYRNWGTWYATADLSNTSVSQSVTLDRDILMVAARVQIIFYNSPALTDLSLKIYSNNAGSPGTLLYTSTAIPKASMVTLANGVKDVPFIFSSPYGVPLKFNDTYHFVINGTGYTGTSSSHIAWKKAFPDPVYSEGLSLDMSDIALAPHYIYLIGAETT